MSSRVQKLRRNPSPDEVAHVRSIFKKFDKDGSKEISREEFDPLIKELGHTLDKYATDKLYASIDTSNNGKIEFAELLDWYPTVPAFAAQGGRLPTRVNWRQITEKLPAGMNESSKAKRMQLYAQFDPNGNGYLSLAEVDKGCRDVLELYDLFDCKPVIMRAFQSARSANDAKNKKGSHGPDYIEKCEFRLLLWYLRAYFELFEMFAIVDSGNDRRIDLGEFKQAFFTLRLWGVQEADPEKCFREVDKNGAGQILFDEFSAWALKKGLDLQDDDDAN